MDVRIAPLNPCSIETIPIPIRLANGQSVWPMMMSCYELTNNHHENSTQSSSSLLSHSITTNGTVVSSLSSTETSSLTNPSQQPASMSSSKSGSGEANQHPPPPPPPQNRTGHMDVSFITVPQNIAHTSSPMPLQLDKNPITLPPPSKIIGGGGGILDGQWSCLPSYILNSSCSNNNITEPFVGNQNYCFASAHSTGEIQLHSMRVIHPDEYMASNDSTKLVDVQFLGRSSTSTTNTKNAIGSTTPNPLCLSLRWDTPAPFIKSTDDDDHSTETTTPQRIVSTYSNGTMAIHDVVTVSSSNVDHSSHATTMMMMKNVQLIERDRWDAHAMFPTHTPAEVWTAAFVNDDSTAAPSKVVWSGGDDMKLKIWDTRSTLRPMLSYHSLFDAGITCIAPHPKHEHIVAVGSCKFFCVCTTFRNELPTLIF